MNHAARNPQSAIRNPQSDVAIIGMACMFPGAPNLSAFWQNIVSKVDAITDPPLEAWDSDIFYDPDSTENDRVYCKKGGYLGPLACFNPLEHGIMPRAAEGGEPDQWLALQVARDALADAGCLDQPKEKHRTAVILGKGTYINRGNLTMVQHSLMVDQTLQVLKRLHPEFTDEDLKLIRQDLKRHLPPFNAETASAMVPNIIAGRIANRLDLMGPSYTVDAACASSLIAVEDAMRGLVNGEYDLALAGGAQVTTPIPILTLFCQLKALSLRERIRPFDKDADGTILGEGLGMAVLKRLEDAERDGDRIYAVIKGVGVASDGRALSVMAPRVDGEELALRRAYEQAGISPRTVGLIEAHGTATLVGDAAEVQALTRVFGPLDDHSAIRNPKPVVSEVEPSAIRNPQSAIRPWCALGTVKSMIGHAMPAAGIAGLIKTALALYHKVLPPTLNVDQPNPRLELEKTPFYINTETRPWIHSGHDAPRRAGVNAFGFGGINAHVILEEHPVPAEAALPGHHLHWETEVCILQAESRSDLILRGEQLQRFLQATPNVSLKDLAYTLNLQSQIANRKSQTRLAIVASSLEDLQRKLDRALKRLADPTCRKIKTRDGVYFFEEPLGRDGKLAFLFPGEGAQYVNMLADLCFHFPEVRRCFDETDAVYADHARGYVPSDFIFPRPAFSDDQRKAAEGRLWQMDVAIEALLTANHALYQLLHRLGIRPDAMLGHSTGEYSAMRATGMLGDEVLFGQRLRELNRLYEGVAAQGGIPEATLVAVGGSREQVTALIEQIGGDLYMAMDNCPHQAVVVGDTSHVQAVIELARRQGLICETLPFDRAYHTPLFEPYAEVLREFLASWIVATPQVPLYSCMTMAPYPSDLTEIRRIAFQHWVRPVEFSKTIEAMYADGVRLFVEVGPRGNLTTFVDDILRGRPYLAVPANVMRRSGITQLNHLVGLLAAHGVPMRLEHLYARRAPQKLALDQPADPTGKGKKPLGLKKLATGWPPMGISEETATRLRKRVHGAEEQGGRGAGEQGSAALLTGAGERRSRGTEEQGSAAPLTGAGEQIEKPEDGETTREAAGIRRVDQPLAGWPGDQATNRLTDQATRRPGDQVTKRPSDQATNAHVMSAYLQTMERFLEVQQEVMQAYLTTADRRPFDAAQDGPLTGDSERRSGRAGEQGSTGAFQQSDADTQPGEQHPMDGERQPSETLPAIEAEPPISQAKLTLPAMQILTQSPVSNLESLSSATIEQVLLRLVSERTGYPTEMLDLELNLEADLGIDSIKRVEILGAFQQETGIHLGEKMEQVSAQRTLQGMIKLLKTDDGGRTVDDGGRTTDDSDVQSPKQRLRRPDLPSNAGVAPISNLQSLISGFPFIQEVLSLTPGQALEARCEVSLDRYPFLRDHTLGRAVSVTDPELTGLPVMPLTMSMEMLAQAAQLLLPDKADSTACSVGLIGMKDVRAYRWVALEQDHLVLKLIAWRQPSAAGNEVHVQVREADAAAAVQHTATSPIIEGIMVFDEAYPEPPAVGDFSLQEERPSRWAPERLYEDGMFHGSAFRGVVSMDRWGEDGAEATLEVLPLEGLFASGVSPTLLTDPVLLDQPGQVVAFWMAEHPSTGSGHRLERGYVIFPFHLEALHLYGSPPPPHEQVKCQARIALSGDWQVRSDLDVVRGDGQVWARLVGWEDRRFDVPREFFRFHLSPKDVVLSEPWPTAVASLAEQGSFQAQRLSLAAFPEDFFTAHGGLWQRVLAHLVLSRRERELWRSLRTPERRRLEWLLGRLTAKDAVRRFLKQRYALILCPADIVILPDDNGRPVAQGPWTDRVPRVPHLSLSHTAGVAVAVVGDCDTGVGVGVDIEHVGRMNEDVATLAFTPHERELLSSVHDGGQDGWPLRFWCAKEAVAKALGHGMIGGPQALVVQDVDVRSGRVEVSLSGELARRCRADNGLSLQAFTAREGDLIVATSLVADGR